jgi:hypothetical protein
MAAVAGTVYVLVKRLVMALDDVVTSCLNLPFGQERKR